MFQIWMLVDNWPLRYKHMKNFNTAKSILQRCPRFWPLAPSWGMNPEVCSYKIADDPPKHPCSRYEWSVVSDCWDISIWKTLIQCDGNGNAHTHADDRGDYNSSPCTGLKSKSLCFFSNKKSWRNYSHLWTATAADNIVIFWHIIWIVCLSDDSHEMSSLISLLVEKFSCLAMVRKKKIATVRNLRFIARTNFIMLSWDERKKSFITSGSESSLSA